MTVLPYLGILIIVGAFLWFARKAGKDAVKADVAEKQVEKTIEANKPIAADERASVVSRYERR